MLAHRVIWSLLLLAGIATLLGRWRTILAALRTGRTAPMLMASALLIGVNWLVYIWAVNGGHVLEASLGYFINPLVNVALGVAILGERLRRMQAVAVALAAVGVLAMAVAGGGAIWVPLTLAFSFGFYGLVRKLAPIDALGGLLVETALLTPLCLIALLWAMAQGGSAFGVDRATDGLLILAGAVTALPLLLFAAAAKRLPYSTVGLLQYIAPTLQFVLAIALFGEALQPIHIFTFGCIWVGCALYAFDLLRGSRAAPA